MNVRRTNKTGLIGAALIAVCTAAPMVAQVPDREGPVDEITAMAMEGPLAQVPFGPGEHLRYKVKWGIFNIGEGHLEVNEVDTVRGHPTYHLSMRMKGGKLGMHVDDHHQSWVDVRNLVSLRFIQDIDEVNYERYRHYEFYPEDMSYERVDLSETDDLATPLPLDDIAFVYFARTLPLEVGETYTVPRYFKESGNPVVIKVLRKEVKEVPAGTFNTVVVQPIIKTRGMFSEDGNAELFFTDDERRLLVYMKTDFSIGNLTLHLEEVSEGTSLNPLDIEPRQADDTPEDQPPPSQPDAALRGVGSDERGEPAEGSR